MDTGIDQILAKKAEKVAAAAERKAEREEKGVVNELIVERSATGLYKCRYERGPVPDSLKGLFTHKQKILDIAKARNIPVRLA